MSKSSQEYSEPAGTASKVRHRKSPRVVAQVVNTAWPEGEESSSWTFAGMPGSGCTRTSPEPAGPTSQPCSRSRAKTHSTELLPVRKDARTA